MSRVNTLESILAKCKKAKSGCLEWTGCFSNAGYAWVGFKGKVHLGHRLLWRLLKGEIPKGKFICHKCDNKRCVNVDHLYVGSRVDNARDAVERGLHPGVRKKACKRGHPYDKENTAITKKGHRYCRA